MPKYTFSTLITVAIAILSLMPVPETPLGQISYIDKWTHVVMYLGMAGAYWLDYLLHQKKNYRPWLGALVYPILLGGLMELLQAYCTNGLRSGEWADWVADAIGAVIGYYLGGWLFAQLKNRLGDKK